MDEHMVAAWAKERIRGDTARTTVSAPDERSGRWDFTRFIALKRNTAELKQDDSSDCRIIPVFHAAKRFTALFLPE